MMMMFSFLVFTRFLVGLFSVVWLVGGRYCIVCSILLSLWFGIGRLCGMVELVVRIIVL